MSEIEIKGHRYKIGRLNARKQFHVTRRLLPVMGSLVALLPPPAPPAPEGQEAPARPDLTSEQLAGMLEPLAGAVAHLSDADSDYVLDTCLGAVERQQAGGSWAAIQPRPGVSMFEDIDMAVMLQLVVEVIKENVAGFLQGIPAP